ncbi:MAG: carbonic anhydrase family protein [Coxiellaceae bacterium]|nr:MAG: carbonic anhydrase family protein [Coxiellaceae bacterium]
MAFDWISKCATSRNALRLGLLSCILWPLLVLAENWSYQGNTGPRHWGRLHKEFKLCLHGQQQSPIDIHTKTAKHANDNLIFHYAAANFSKNAVGDKLFTLSNARNYVLFNNEQFF